MGKKAFTGQGGLGATTSDFMRTEFVVRQVMNSMATATLVQVVAVDGDTVDIKPMVAQLDGAGNAIPHGTIHKAPWFRIRAGATAIDITPVAGDIGLAIFCHNDISAVKKAKKPSTPGSRRRYSWSDALYLGGFLGATPTQYIRLDADGIAIHAASGKPVTITSTDKVSIVGPLDADTEYRVDGVRVLTNRQAAIAAPTGGATIDTQSRTTLASIITALQAHGLTA